MNRERCVQGQTRRAQCTDRRAVRHTTSTLHRVQTDRREVSIPCSNCNCAPSCCSDTTRVCERTNARVVTAAGVAGTASKALPTSTSSAAEEAGARVGVGVDRLAVAAYADAGDAAPRPPLSPLPLPLLLPPRQRCVGLALGICSTKPPVPGCAVSEAATSAESVIGGEAANSEVLVEMVAVVVVVEAAAAAAGDDEEEDDDDDEDA